MSPRDLSPQSDLLEPHRRRGETSSLAPRPGAAWAALALALVLVAVGPLRLSAATPFPTFVSGGQNPFGLAPGPDDPAPAVADLDDDGDLDVVVGQGDGSLRYLQNTGSVTAPAFAAALVNPFGLTAVDGSASPALADIDGDGDLDAFVGTLGGQVRFQRNVGTATAPAFAAAASLGLDIPGASRLAPTFADLDGDGDFDAFVGNESGSTHYFANTGTATTPVFADLDRDGDLDALIGSFSGGGKNPFSGNYFENTGTPSTPAFAPSFAIFAYYRARPAFGDFDGDGDLDLLVGGQTLGDLSGSILLLYSTARGWYFTVTPCRTFDSRAGTALSSGVEMQLQLLGHCGIPATARVVAMNLTVTESSGSGYLQVNAAGLFRSTSTLNFAAGATRANNAVLVLGSYVGFADCPECQGKLAFYPVLDDGGSVQLIVDVVGYSE